MTPVSPRMVLFIAQVKSRVVSDIETVEGVKAMELWYCKISYIKSSLTFYDLKWKRDDKWILIKKGDAIIIFVSEGRRNL